jgi:hypothetical protein
LVSATGYSCEFYIKTGTLPMVEENEFIEIIVPLIEKLPNYIHLAKVV